MGSGFRGKRCFVCGLVIWPGTAFQLSLEGVGTDKARWEMVHKKCGPK